MMPYFIFSFSRVVAADFAYLNYRFLRLSPTGGLMALKLVLSLKLR